jgi:hypothetical protein
MKYYHTLILFVAILLSSCQQKAARVDYAVDPNNREVKVVDVVQASAYTYLEVSEKGEKFWIAVNLMEAKKGDVLHFSQSMEMTDFHSRDLNRTFEKLHFVDDISSNPIPMKGHATQSIPPGSMKSVTGKKEISVKTPEGAVSIGDLFASKASYNQQKIKVAGEVVKVNAAIMGKNWVHLQDGTGDQQNYDLTITTQDVVRVGDVVVFEGIIAVDKDFGSGYTYDLIMEEAVVVTQPVY